MNVYSVAPIRTPINFNSERISERKKIIQLFSTEENLINGFSRVELDWPFGYGTIEHDNIPEFLQPAAKLKFINTDFEQSEIIFRQFTEKYNLQFIECFLYIFDDTIALVEISFEVIDTIKFTNIIGNNFDGDLSNITTEFALKVIVPEFMLLVQKLENLKSKFSAIISPSNFKVMDCPYTGDAPDANVVLWVGRYIISENDLQKEILDTLKKWVLPDRNKDSNETEEIIIGLGNSLIITNKAMITTKNWQRVCYISQFYYALCTVLEQLIINSIESLHESSSIRKNTSKKVQALIDKTNMQLNHLQFSKIQIGRARLGTQSVRRILLEKIMIEWKINELEQNIENWMSLANNKLDRIKYEMQYRQNKIVQILLTVIGSLGLVDFFINLVNTGKTSKPDSVPGLFDLFALFSLDAVLWSSLLFLGLITFFISRES